MLCFERARWEVGCVRVAGVDEAGRGPLAGPVVAAAVVLDRLFAETEADGLLNGLTDSKKLSESNREKFFEILERSGPAEIAVGVADPVEIDRINILRATQTAMARAVRALSSLPDHVLVDGRPVAGLDSPSTAIVRGDSLSLTIAAASVVAKVVRDRLMRQLDRVYPAYGFAQHKGYGCRAHVQALLEHGPCPVHRRSFRPVREAAAIWSRSVASIP